MSPMGELAKWNQQARVSEKRGRRIEESFARGVVFGIQLIIGQKMQIPGLPAAIREHEQCEQTQTRAISA